MTSVHPALRPRGFAANTQPFVEMKTALTESWSRGEQCFVVYGESQNGKTTILEQLFRSLQASRSMVPFWYHSINYEVRNPAAKFWRGFQPTLEQGEDYIAVASPYDNLVALIRTHCEKAGTERAVLMLDEAQAMDVARFDMLKALTEDLIRRRIVPHVVLAAQPEILTKVAELKARQRRDLIARFLLRMHRFPGLTAKTLPTLLAHYDEHRWPAEGPTYTEYFVPDLVRDRRWRLVDHAPELWLAFEQEAAKLGLATNKLEIGARYCAGAAVALMQLLHRKPELNTTRSAYAQAVAESQFASAFEVGTAEDDARDRLKERAKRRLDGRAGAGGGYP